MHDFHEFPSEPLIPVGGGPLPVGISWYFLYGQSLYELVCARKPPDLTNLTFNSIEGLSNYSYSECLAPLQKRFEHVSQTMLNLQKHNQDRQTTKTTNKMGESPIYPLRQSVYLYKQTSSSLTSNFRKTVAEWVVRLAKHEILDFTHHFLNPKPDVHLQDKKGDILPPVTCKEVCTLYRLN